MVQFRKRKFNPKLQLFISAEDNKLGQISEVVRVPFKTGRLAELTIGDKIESIMSCCLSY